MAREPDNPPRERRKNSPEELDRLRSAFFLSGDATFILDAEGRFLKVNQAACDAYGYTQDELLRKNIGDLVPPEQARNLPDRIAKIRRDGVAFFETVHATKDGRFIPTEVTATHVRNRDASSFICICRDVSERKRADEKLAQLAAIVESSGDAIFSKDMSGTILSWNLSATRLYGYSAGEMVGRSIAALVPDDQPDDFRRILERIGRGEKVLHYETVRVGKDGRKIDVSLSVSPLLDSEGRIVGASTIARDIGDRKRAEAALRMREEEFSTILRTARDGFWIIGRDGRFLEVNDAVPRIFGYGRDELLGMSVSDIEVAEKPSAGPRVLRKIMEGGGGRFEAKFRRRDGAVLDMEISSNYLQPPHDRFFVFLRDITERRRLEEERLRLEEQMRHTQKLESLGVLAGGIAHDFNNLLMAIIGYTDLALAKLSPNSPVREYLVEVDKASQRAANICRQMLAYSGKGRFLLQSLNLNKVIREMSHVLEVSISKKAMLQYRFSPVLPPVDADLSQVRQVVMNLVVNASEAIGESSGIISVTTGAKEFDRAYLRDASPEADLPAGTYVFIEVADTGCGMDEETRNKIFDPFFTTKFTGRGLGLAAVLGIVRGHRGAIRVSSERGKGTSVQVLFPPSVKSAALPADTVPAKGGWKGTGTVLLADDEEVVRRLGAGMLEAMGFRVLTAVNGRDAVEVFRAHRGEIVCALLDLTMPVMDGEEAFREMRRIRPDLRVLLSSGYSEQEVLQRFEGEGLAGILQKPYKSEDLAAKLRRIVNGKREDPVS